jgi:hypothetical protein
MSVFTVRNVLPVVTSVVAVFLLASAVRHDRAPAHAGARAELPRCVADGRETDECLDEAAGNALIERAEWMARDDDASRRASR